MLQGIETLANPLLTTTAENFMKLVDSNSDRKCDFPPAIAPSEDTIKLCTESNDQENMPIARTVCDSIVKLSELVCRIQNFSIKVIDVMISLKASKEDLCSHVEIQHLFTTEKCSDIVETGPVFHTLRLYSAMLKSLFKTFEGILTFCQKTCVLGQDSSKPSLVQAKPRKDMNNVSCFCYMTEILLK